MKKAWILTVMAVLLTGCISKTSRAAAEASTTISETAAPTASAVTKFTDLTYDESVSYGLDVDHTTEPDGTAVTRMTVYHIDQDGAAGTVDRYYYYYHLSQLSAVIKTSQQAGGQEEPAGSGFATYADGRLSQLDYHGVDLYQADRTAIYELSGVIDRSSILYQYGESATVVQTNFGDQDLFYQETYTSEGLLSDACEGLGQEKGACPEHEVQQNSQGLLLSSNTPSMNSADRYEYYPNGLLYRRMETVLSQTSKTGQVTVYEYGSESQANSLFAARFPRSGMLDVKYDQLDIMTGPGSKTERTRLCENCAALESNNGDRWTVFDSSEADGYTWYQVGTNAWVPSVPGVWTEFSSFIQ